MTDYKTGSYPDPPPQITGRGEVLQPALYALAAEQIYPATSITGGRLFYATLRESGGAAVCTCQSSISATDGATTQIGKALLR